MTARTQYVLNPTNAAIIGINDELVALYRDIMSIYDKEIEEFSLLYPDKTIFPNDINKAVKGKVRKTIDHFLPGITSVFTDEYVSLHPNEFAMTPFDFFIVKHTKPLTLQVRYVSYAEFLQDMQDFVVRVILQRKRHTLPKYAYERVENDVICHIKNTLEERQEKKVLIDSSGVSETLKGMIIIFENLSAISCNLNNHMVESIMVPVPLLNSSNLVRLPIHHCVTCGRYFIGSETLRIYEKLYGRFFIRTIREGADPAEFAFFGESELHKTGYNVRKDGMTKAERQDFLSRLISEEIMSKFGICRDIQNAIKIFDNRPEYIDAVAKWREDLFYVSETFDER